MSISSTTGVTPSRSPEPLTSGGPTSSTPTTPAQTQTQVPATTVEGGLRSRAAAAADGVAGMARRVGLPQAAAAVRASSVTQALGGLASAVVTPAASLVVDVVATGIKGVKQARQSSASSQPLQAALRGNLAEAGAQMGAHEQAAAYGQHSAQMLDRVLPFVLSVARIGVAGTSMAFGLGRNSGLAAGDALGRAERGAAQSGSFISGSAAPAAILSSQAAGQSVATGVQQWLLGSATGAVGNLAGQFLVAPLLNLIPRQFNPIDARAVVPDEIVDLMNQLKPGSGSELRDKVKATQGEISNISSESNVQLGQFSFDAVTAGRFAIQGATPLGASGQVAVGLAVSATAGAAIGAVMAIRQSVTTVDIPKIADLREAVAAAPADGAAALAQVPTNAVPLYFAKHMGAAAPAPGGEVPHDIETGHAAAAANESQRSRMSQTLDTIKNGVIDFASGAGGAVKQGFVTSALNEPRPTTPGAEGASAAGRALATASNVAASGVRRFGQMAASTVVTSSMSTVSNMLASATEGPAQRAVLALGNAVGIHTAIKPWFDALARDIPAGDNTMRAQRQESVNAQAVRRPQV